MLKQPNCLTVSSMLGIFDVFVFYFILLDPLLRVGDRREYNKRVKAIVEESWVDGDGDDGDDDEGLEERAADADGASAAAMDDA